MLENKLNQAPDSFKEYLQFLDVEKILELTYLNVARSIIVTRERLHLSPNDQLQLLFLYADGTTLENMALDLLRQAPELNLKITSKPFSRKAISDIMNGPQTGANWTTSDAAKLFTQIMIEDTRLGKFDPKLPTLWIDSFVQFSIIPILNKLKDVPLGNPPLFFSINYTHTDNIEKGSFETVFSAQDFFDPLETPFVERLEGLARLPIDKSRIEFDQANTPSEGTLQFSEERNQQSRYYLSSLWALGPEHKNRRLELLTAAQDPRTYINQVEKILS